MEEVEPVGDLELTRKPSEVLNDLMSSELAGIDEEIDSTRVTRKKSAPDVIKPSDGVV